MSKNAIRVQLPGGAPYAPALKEAAVKTGARSGLTKTKATSLTKMVVAAVALLNSGDASIITLEMRIHDGSFVVRVIGKGCLEPSKASVTKLGALAAKRADSFDLAATKSARTVSFVI